MSGLPDDDAEAGGDPACWIDRVCPACGAFVASEPPVDCPRCGRRFER